MSASNCGTCGNNGVALICGDCGRPICVNCGTPQSNQSGSVLALLFGMFLPVHSLRTYFRILFRILRRPIVNTVDIFEERRIHDNLRFFEVSLLVYTLLTVSKAAQPGSEDGFTQELLLGLYYVIFMSGFVYVFYLLARRRSTVQRTSYDVLSMYMLQVGFASSAFFLLMLAQWLFVFSAEDAAILFLALQLLLIAHSVKTWKYFWRDLSTTRIFFYTLVAGIVPAFVATPLVYQ